jgi:hypothetical protein
MQRSPHIYRAYFMIGTPKNIANEKMAMFPALNRKPGPVSRWNLTSSGKGWKKQKHGVRQGPPKCPEL